MGADCGTDGGDWQIVCLSLPENGTVSDIFLQQSIVQTGIAKAVGHGEINAAAFLHVLHQHIVAVFGAPCLTQNDNFSFYNGDDGFDGKHGACPGSSFGDASALFQVFQRINNRKDDNLVPDALQLSGNFSGGKSLLAQPDCVKNQILESDADI